MTGSQSGFPGSGHTGSNGSQSAPLSGSQSVSSLQAVSFSSASCSNRRVRLFEVSSSSIWIVVTCQWVCTLSVRSNNWVTDGLPSFLFSPLAPLLNPVTCCSAESHPEQSSCQQGFVLVRRMLRRKYKYHHHTLLCRRSLMHLDLCKHPVITVHSKAGLLTIHSWVAQKNC